MISKERALEIVETYKQAWINQSVEKILSIFDKDGIYHEYVLREAYVGHDEIKAYWERKVLDEQSNIEFKLLNVYIDGDTFIAEWDASFDSNVKNKRVHIQQVAILETKDGLITHLREYWHSEKFPLPKNQEKPL